MTSTELNIKEKLVHIGFSGFDLVIDAACGTGFWANTLTQINKNVIGYDNSIEMIKEAHGRYANITNLNFIAASLLHQPFKDIKADAIICADSLMFVNPISTLNSFHKILKSNGKVYISVNGIGWIFNCIFSRGIKKKDISKINMGLKIMLDTLIRRLFSQTYKVTNTVYTLRDLRKIASITNFKVIYAGYEGTYLNTSLDKYKSLFDKKYFGIPQSLEIVLKKNNGT